MITTDARLRSILAGMIIPDSEARRWFKCKDPSLHAMKQLQKEHRWNEMRGIIRELFNHFADLTTEYEISILDALKLPPIEEVRAQFEGKQGAVFEYPPEMDALLQAIWKEWTEEILEAEGTYYLSQQQAYSVGLRKTLDKILEQLPDEMRDIAVSRQVLATLDNPLLRALQKEAGKRIKSITAHDLRILRRYLNRMAREGGGVVQVARYVHKKAGEGAAWKWLMRAQSEMVIASETAYNDQANQLGVHYDLWSCGANPCEICGSLCGKVWKRGEGPEPVSDTHPWCVCVRVPQFETDRPVQRLWERASPYTTQGRWTSEAIAEMREILV